MRKAGDVKGTNYKDNIPSAVLLWKLLWISKVGGWSCESLPFCVGVCNENIFCIEL